jgi:hypothetical protein
MVRCPPVDDVDLEPRLIATRRASWAARLKSAVSACAPDA